MTKAVVLGAAGGIGQPLSLLLKTSPLISELGLFDIVNTPGVAADLSHIATPAKVEGYLPPDDGLGKALQGADLVVIPAGVPRKPGMTRDKLFDINAGIVRDLATGIAKHAPKAFVLVISNPVNSTVPIVVEVFKQHGVFNPKKIFGVTTLDVVRASTFVAEKIGDLSLASAIRVPVIGGHSGATIVPLLSQSSHPLPANLTQEDIATLTNRVQYGGDEVVKAKDGAGSATLSMAYAGAEFAEKVLRALKGEKGINAPSFVHLTADEQGGKLVLGELETSFKEGLQITKAEGEYAQLEYFSVKVELGAEGVEKILPIGNISEYEKGLIVDAVKDLKGNIEKGVAFIQAPKL